jgi:myo-inositol-1(or 4)-monophosphatase
LIEETQLDAERKLARDLAAEAGELIMTHFAPDIAVDEKGWADPVTEADRASEVFIQERLRKHFPRDGIYGEEFGRVRGESGRVWLVDPLDGTANFAGGSPVFAVCLTLVDIRDEDAGRPILNVTYDPVRGEMFEAWAGGGAWLNGRTIRVGTRANLAGALVQITFPRDRPLWEASLILVRRLTEVAPHARNIGSSALAQAWVATGRLDAHARVSTGAFDIVGGNLLIEEAGGIVTNLAGEHFVDGGDLLAASSAMHGLLVGLRLKE